MSSAILAELILCPRMKGTLQIALPVNYGTDHVVGNRRQIPRGRMAMLLF